MSDITVNAVAPNDAKPALQLVADLLSELGEEGDEAGEMDAAGLLATWQQLPASHVVFVARDGSSLVGVITIAEAFAFYAGGRYGIINEMYVRPDHRSKGVGALLLDAAKDLARQRHWRRIDVTGPESSRWIRTRQFYEREGFVFTGPKLKYPCP